MIAMDDIDLVTAKRVLSKKHRLQRDKYSEFAYKGMKLDQVIKNPWQEPGEYPISKWIMPPQPECYIKYTDHDLL